MIHANEDDKEELTEEEVAQVMAAM